MGEIVDKHERRIGELEDELKKAKRRIEELKAELADAEMLEHVDGECEIREQRRDAFDGTTRVSGAEPQLGGAVGRAS